MSRNIGRTDCQQCGGPVELVRQRQRETAFMLDQLLREGPLP